MDRLGTFAADSSKVRQVPSVATRPIEEDELLVMLKHAREKKQATWNHGHVTALGWIVYSSP
jgi:hypothetical protein